MRLTSTFDVAQRCFRLSSLFRLVPIDRLTSQELGQLAIEDGVELGAVLVPTAPFLSAKGICQRSLELLERFRIPRELPKELTKEDRDLIIELTLDSVVEIQVEGQFISGALFSDLWYSGRLEEPTKKSAPTRISYEALQYAESLRISDPGMLSSKLYFFNRIPLSSRWCRRFATEESIGRWLDLGNGRHSGWSEMPPAPDNPSWRFFSRDARASGGRCKIYINVHGDFLPDAIRSVLPVLLEHGFGSFKICRELPGLLRPDKFVAYAQSFEEIRSASKVLLSQLRGIPVQVSPFTAAIDEEGLLSWGLDPPRHERLSARQGKSWRRWLTDRLAISLIAARGMGAKSALRYALQRLAFDGIDVNTWAPDSGPLSGEVRP